ncbi:hypothetical protein QCA50_019944 [Cerrena zonata]|uniref:Uncharacterized protein n=1 Tax=Cerrena zonata TaxID=2478898 RepID=A0AAW0FA87_9APHY
MGQASQFTVTTMDVSKRLRGPPTLESADTGASSFSLDPPQTSRIRKFILKIGRVLRLTNGEKK